MEEQLAAYRARKAKERASHGTWLSALRTRFSGSPSPTDGKEEPPTHETVQGTTHVPVGRTDSATSGRGESYWNLESALKLLLWLCLLGAFVFIGLGGVFLLISVICLLYFTMGTKKRAAGELSAYSVFNPNCERLDGQLTAEQFENELKYGSVGM